MFLPASPQEGLRGRSPRSNAAERHVDAASVGPLGILAETTPAGESVGVYVHVPFCAKRCDYCSFNTAALGERDVVTRYLRALRREIELLATAAWVRRIRVETIFFGGGTPSLLEADEIATVLDALHGAFAVEDGAEITVECNPESVTREKLAGYRAAGLDRISLGVQSLDDAILPAIGRLHTAAAARAAFDAARCAGFANVSVDVMYGLPGLSIEGWSATVDGVLAWEPEHVSAYGLTLDPGSVWGSSGVAALPPEETVVAQYWALAERGAARGYEHYEISNYARPGFRSRHNQIYWRRREYLACGPGAAGFVGDVRYGNVKPVTRYAQLLEADRLPIETFERLDTRQALAETLMLGLRTTDGVSTSVLHDRAVDDPALWRRIALWREQGLLIDHDDRTRLSEAGFLLSDTLFIDLL